MLTMKHLCIGGAIECVMATLQNLKYGSIEFMVVNARATAIWTKCFMGAIP